MVSDRAGNTFKQANDIKLSSFAGFKDRIGGHDTNDFFRFRLSSRSSVNFSLNGKADLQLFGSNSQPLKVGKGRTLSSINTNLKAGTYYISVSSSAKRSTSYLLNGGMSLTKPMASNDDKSLSTNASIAYPHHTSASNTLGTGVDDGSIIDVMIAYTADARAAEGGTDAINRVIQAAVVEVNQGYANSGIVQRLRLVHTVEVNYTESGSAKTDLTRLQNKADGHMDDAHAMRDKYGADIVSLFVKKSDSGGKSYVMNRVSHEFESYAFNVVQIDNVKTRFSFGHELGHNLGAAHDRAHIDSDAAFSYSYGYITESGIGDIMSYAKDRRNVYSNPNVKINGETIGKADEADVAKAFNNVRFTAANWRKSVVG
ncbi:pre-peptidase C-terminal domain-containing protein [Phormidium tenue FACHB-886]|nr:pre-peptidase C-terminal domain-containing protein [Phormidium tenue FACHB-886]